MIKRILFVHNSLTPFVRIDRDLIAGAFEIEEMYLRRKTNMNPFKIWKAIRRNEIVFAWFASWHSLLPIYFASLQKKPSILVSGGYDTARLPEAGYGNQRGWWKKRITNFILRKCSHIICNSNFAKNELLKITRGAAGKISMIYHGIPVSNFPTIDKSALALNVGNVLEENLLRKGIEPFLSAGKLLPSYHFIQAGKWKDKSYQKLLKYTSANVELKGFVPEEELQSLYARSKVYVQPSLHEAFGMSVAEAMQAGCIPVVTTNGALPEVVGKFGIFLDDTSPESIIKGIKQAEQYPYSPHEIRQFIMQTYSVDLRRNKLLKCITQFDK